MTLRNQVLSGSAFLALREGLGTALSLGGMLLLTRAIGPESYGVYASAFAVLVYLIGLSELGVGTYLIRSHEEQGEEAFHQAFTLLLGLSAAGVLLTLAALPLLERAINLPDVGRAIVALILGLPVVHLIKVPMARLEHALDYRRVAGIEFAGQVAFYAAAVPLGFSRAGFWAPIGGWWAQHVVHLVLVYRTGYRPRLVWRPQLIRTMLRFGVSYSVSLWVVQLREFVNPMVVGRLLGASAVGYVALAIRIVDSLGFVKVATTRISIAALARVQGAPERLSRALTEGMVLQVLAVGPFLVGFAVFGPPAVSLVFGREWLPMLEVFPLISVGYLASSMWMLHSSSLVVLHRNYDIALVNLANVVVLAGAALLLVPRLGAAGYGWAEVATVPTYLLYHFFLVRRGVRPRYAHAALWFLASALPLLAGRWVIAASVALLLPLVYAPMRREVQAVAQIVLQRLRPGAGAAVPDAVPAPALEDAVDGAAVAAGPAVGGAPRVGAPSPDATGSTG
jgi:PST family polysaccharide transporter